MNDLRKSFVYRLYPTKAQARRLDSVLETCRRFYNDCLAERKTAYEERGETVGKVVQLRRVKNVKATNPYAKDVHSHILQVVVADLDRAFDAFFRRVKAGEKPGYPRFRGRNRWRSFGFKELGNGFKIDGRRLKLSGIGRIAVRWHRPREGQIKTLRISKKAGKWYAAFSCVVEARTLPPTGQEVGIDVGLASLITTSDGEAASAGRVVMAVDPRHTSKTCSQCGHIFEGLTLKDRWIACACGLSLDRDHNAAINIRNRAGQARWALSSPLGGLAQEAAGL